MNHDNITRRTTMSSRATTNTTSSIQQMTSNNNNNNYDMEAAAVVSSEYSYNGGSSSLPKPGRRRRQTRRSRTGGSLLVSSNYSLDRRCSCRNIQRQTTRYLRRNPEKVYTLIIVVFGITFIICLGLSALFQRHGGGGPTTTITTSNTDDAFVDPLLGIRSLPGGIVDSVNSNSNNKNKKIGDKIITDKTDDDESAIHKNKKRTHHVPKKNTKKTKELETDKRKATTTTKRNLVHESSKPIQAFFSTSQKSIHTSFEDILIVEKPQKLSEEHTKTAKDIDYGGLNINIFQEKEGDNVRQIRSDPWLTTTDFRDPSIPQDDDYETYYAFDDDILRNEFFETDLVSMEGKVCRRISEHRINYQTCNTFHETSRLENKIKYLNEGAYRQVVVLDHSYAQEQEKIILKDIQYGHNFTIDDYEYTRMDGMVAERLSSSPRIYDIYGMCGQGILSEYFVHGDMEYIAIPGEGHPDEGRTKEDPLKSYNDLTGIQKLAIALQMAQAVADLHGYKGGVIVHQDIQLSQFLFNNDLTRVKLNDFNRAEFVLWDEANNEYCKYTEGKGHGDWRSPEEFVDGLLNEKVDVFSLGNNFYSILTGLWVFYDSEDTKESQERVKKGELPYIDPRYKEKDSPEAALAEVIEWCLTHDPEKRPSVFDVVAKLNEALMKYVQDFSSQNLRLNTAALV